MDKDRRYFLENVGRTAGGAALCGLGLTLYARKSASLPAEALRPPGALAETQFLGACVRCGLCVRDCPYDTLKLARLDDPVPTGTPYFAARQIPCEMCDDVPCVAACPTGALDPDLTDIDDARMGTAVLVDQENCLNFLGLRCDVCYRACPLIDEAIRIELQPSARSESYALMLPTVHADACTGCGKCEYVCVLEEAAIKILPQQLARGQGGDHYRIGWEEQEADEGLIHSDTPFPADPLETLDQVGLP